MQADQIKGDVEVAQLPVEVTTTVHRDGGAVSSSPEYLDQYIDVLERIQDLESQNWNALPADDPRKCQFGFIAFRYVEDNTGEVLTPPITTPNFHEESKLFYWRPLGEITVEETFYETAAEFESAVDAMRYRGIYRCDNPEKLKLGFVSYDVKEKKSYVVQMPVSQMGKLSELFQLQIRIHSANSMKWGKTGK